MMAMWHTKCCGARRLQIDAERQGRADLLLSRRPVTFYALDQPAGLP
jgi:hypothetical protein